MPRTLKMPSEARAEVAEIKAQLEAYKSFKEESMRLGQRHRTISQGWKHGVTGVDDADSPKAQEFYQSAKNQKEAAQAEKDVINKRRLKCKLLNFRLSHWYFRNCTRYGNEHTTWHWIS